MVIHLGRAERTENIVVDFIFYLILFHPKILHDICLHNNLTFYYPIICAIVIAPCTPFIFFVSQNVFFFFIIFMNPQSKKEERNIEIVDTQKNI